MEYGMLFIIGLITSVHCVAMCGGINLSQSIPTGETSPSTSRLQMLQPTFLYNLGRVISYTVIGFIVGALGFGITFSNTAQGILKLIAGIFMVIMGLNMLNLFPALRKFNPRIPKSIGQKLNLEKYKGKNPLIIGLLNGLMPCGPLQAMQIYALSTGNPLTGALSMLLFSLGTVPLMFGLGALSTMLGTKFKHKMMTAGAVLVVVLGLSMFTQGWSLSGAYSGSFAKSLDTQSSGGDPSSIVMENGSQVIDSTLTPGQYPAIAVQADIPVKWIIEAPEGSINGCNNRLFIREYGIEHTFQTGENVIEFTPEQTGTFLYSCWMGMIRSTITVVAAGEEIPAVEETVPSQQGGLYRPTVPKPSGVAIQTEDVAIASLETRGAEVVQTVEINLTDNGFVPAIVVLQAGLDTEWNIINQMQSSTNTPDLLVPLYYTQLTLETEDNLLYLNPTDSFEFSTGDHASYGYVKVVADGTQVDIAAIQAEAAAVETLIYPDTFFRGAGGSSCCH